MTKILCIFLLFICIAGCSTESSDDSTQSLFAVPPIIEEPETEASAQPDIPVQPEPDPVPEPVPQPEPVPPHGGARDLVAPKLVEGDIQAGDINVDVDLDHVGLEFDEKIGKSDLKIVNRKNKSLKWTQIIEGKKVILVKLDGADLEMENGYSITGAVEDEHQNARVIHIPFTTVVKE